VFANSRSIAARALAIAIALTSACSLLVDTNADPCKTDADCKQSGATCGPEHLCVAPAEPSADAATDVAADAATEPDVGTTCTDQACCSTPQCIADHGGAPFTCPRAGSPCVSVITPACPRVIGDATAPGAVLIGFVTPLTGSNAQTGAASTDLADLAIHELEQSTTGLPGEGGAHRAVAAVVCDDVDDAAFTHLIDELHLPVIVSGGTSARTVDVTPKLVKSDVFYMCGDCGSPALTTLDDHALVWRTNPSLADYGAAMAAYVRDDVEALVRTANGLSPTDPVRLAIVSSRAFLFSSTSDVFASRVVYNGKTPLGNGGNFLRLDYDDPVENPNVDLDAIVASVVGYAPHVIFIAGGDEAFLSLMPEIEAGWTQAVRPFYVSANTQASTYTFIAAHPDVRTRYRNVSGTYDQTSRPFHDAYVLRMNARFPSGDPDLVANVYDALWSTFYGMAAVDAAVPLTGSRVAAAMERLTVPPNRVGVGPADANQGFAALQQDGGIDLVGVYTNLDFDSAGDVHASASVSCAAPTQTPLDAGVGYGNFDTKRLYDPTTDQMTGVDDCP
jgi:hypothetical protein